MVAVVVPIQKDRELRQAMQDEERRVIEIDHPPVCHSTGMLALVGSNAA